MVRKEIYLNPDSGIRNDFSAGITRKDFYCCRTARVPEPEYRALIRGLQRILQEAERNITICDFGNHNLEIFQPSRLNTFKRANFSYLYSKTKCFINSNFLP